MAGFGVIGSNFITDWFLEAGKKVDGFKLEAVYSRTRERAEEYAAKHQAPKCFDSLDQLAACPDVTAVYIASPTAYHYQHTMQMLKAGKHVICEKPMASNLRQAREMFETARSHGVVLIEAIRSVYDPNFEIIRDNLDKLGPIRKADFQYCQYSSRYDKFKNGIIENAFRPELSNGAIMDIGVYCIHLAAALFGKPKQIQANAVILPDSIDGAGNLAALYQDKQIVIQYSKITASDMPCEIQGELGNMYFSHAGEPIDVEIRYRDGRIEKLSSVKVDNNMHYEIAAFITMIEGRKEAEQYQEYTLLAMEMMDEARKQCGIRFPADQD